LNRTIRMNPKPLALAGGALLAGCGTAPSPQDLDRATQAVVQTSFRAQGIATLDRLH
jgi:hypothetical protein